MSVRAGRCSALCRRSQAVISTPLEYWVSATGHPIARARWNPARGRQSRNVKRLVLLLDLQRQAHGLAGRHRALDGDGGLEIDTGLLRRAMNGRRAGREVIEPGARLVAERAPEIADRPIARGVAAEKGHVHGMVRHVGMRDALLREQEMIEVIVVDDHGPLAAEELDAVGLAERGIARRQRVADAEID